MQRLILSNTSVLHAIGGQFTEVPLTQRVVKFVGTQDLTEAEKQFSVDWDCALEITPW